MIVLDKDIIGPWIAKRCNMVWTSENSQTIGWAKDGKIVAGVWYEDYNGRSVTCHIAIEGFIGRQFLGVIFDYPFNQLQVEQIICPIICSNKNSTKLVRNMGFDEYVRLPDIHPNGDMVLFILKKENCKFLGDRYGIRKGLKSPPCT